MPSLDNGIALKKRAQPIVMLTCYSTPTARHVEAAGVDVALVGDSLGTTLLGYENTTHVTMSDMLVHTAAVARGISSIPIIADMPFQSYEDPEMALQNARLLIKAGAHAVKLEGPETAIITYLQKHEIEVCAHLGYLPQSAEKPRVQGKHAHGAQELLDHARAIEAAGALMVVLELVPDELSAKISQSISIPTIGIGAGVHCDGQVQVLDDLLGVSDRVFKHAKMFATQAESAVQGISQYCQEVRKQEFPTADNVSHINDDILSDVE
ncbi:MAG: 3-methyl-2-oxobutanoate hydroxymethyltransferase [Planctomycetes bacterium]|nr:3-methyl-2-oxobutanoate hydroxymethyltransferase [Planctomycetota bacterium]